MKDSFVFYISQYIAIKDLTNEQLGRLFRALFENQLQNNSKQLKTTENNVVLDDDIKIAFNFINNQMLVDNEKYIKKCERLKENGKKGGAPKGNQNARKQPKQPNQEKNNLNDNDNDNDNVNDNELLIPTDVVINNNNSKSQQQTIFDLIQEGFGRTLNGIECEEIASWEDNELTRYAIRKSILNGKCTIGYISTVLRSYKNKSIVTVQQAQAEEKEYKEGKEKKTEYKTIQQKNFEFLEQRKKQREAENDTN